MNIGIQISFNFLLRMFKINADFAILYQTLIFQVFWNKILSHLIGQAVLLFKFRLSSLLSEVRLYPYLIHKMLADQINV